MDADKTLTVTTNSERIGDRFLTNLVVNPPPKAEERNGACIIAVLDISGSMDCEATQGEAKESDGFSRLDLVKHSVNTIIHSLEEKDSLALVTFSNHARVDLKITKMDAKGQEKALDVV